MGDVKHERTTKERHEERRRPRTAAETHRCREAARKAHERASTRKARLLLLRTALIIFFLGLGVLEIVRPDLLAVFLGAYVLIPTEGV